MGDRIVAIYTSRPNPHSKFHRVGYMLLEAFNAECLMENEDMEFKIYLDSIHQTEQWLIPSFNISSVAGFTDRMILSLSVGHDPPHSE